MPSAGLKAIVTVWIGAPPSLGAQHWDFGNRLSEGGATLDKRVRQALILALDVPLISSTDVLAVKTVSLALGEIPLPSL